MSWRRFFAAPLLVIGFASTALAAPALPVSVSYDPMKFNVCGVLTNVGSMTATLSTGANRRANDNTITASATVNAPYNGCGTFHWIQIIVSADKGTFAPLTYNGNPVDSASNPNAIPIVDPPSGGYAGQPDDTDPWYLTAAEEGGSTPGLGGNTTNAGGTTFVMKDQPNYGGFVFDTFFVADTSSGGTNSMAVIAGFTWGYGSTGGANTLSLLGNNPGVAAGALASLNTALGNSGFGTWTATNGFDENCCCCEVPLPNAASAGFVLIGVMLGGTAVRRRVAA